jgi:hypothetical protein
MLKSALFRFGALPAAALCAGLGLSQAAAQTPPDFTGVWTNYRAAGAGQLAAGQARPPGVAGVPGAGARPARGATDDLPMKPETRKLVAEYRALVEPGQDNPGSHCLGTGMPGSMLGSGGYPMEIIQRPDQITIIYEAHNEIRRIYFGSRVVPPEDRLPDRNGYSVGRWEGDTLVVETDFLKEQVDQRMAHSDQAKIVERYKLTEEEGRKTLTATMTMTDPVFYTAPVKAEKKWSIVPNGRVMPYECVEPDWLDYLEELKTKAAAKQTAAGPQRAASQ